MCDLRGLLREVDYVLPSLDEIKRMTGQDGSPEQLMQALRDAGARDIILKLGAEGAASLVGDEMCRAAPVPVRALNATAAGECFNAGVLHGLATAMPLRETVDLANMLAAHYVGTGRYVTLAEIARGSWEAAPAASGRAALRAG